jgi:hypothetical protein
MDSMRSLLLSAKMSRLSLTWSGFWGIVVCGDPANDSVVSLHLRALACARTVSHTTPARSRKLFLLGRGVYESMTTLKSSPWKSFVRAAKNPVWHTVHSLTGIRMALPVHFLDMTMMGGVFRLDPEQAAQLVSNDLFSPSIAEDGLARCHVTALEYRSVDIMYPYNELAVTIPGKIRGVDRETDLHYYLQLPVTTEDARWTGVEIYGFPKYIAAIAFEESDSDVVCALTLAGQEVLTLHVSKGIAKDDEWDVENLTYLDGEPLLSVFQGCGRRYASAVPGGSRLQFGEQRMAQGLRSAQIEPTSVSHFYCPGMRATLSAPVKLKKAGNQTRS